jgi:hypothetical protein
MCAAPTWAADAAWSEADATWERLQVEAAEAFAAHDLAGAGASWAAAVRIARVSFAADDPRLAAGLANWALALRLRGEAAADRLFAEALEIWDAAPAWLTRQAFTARARSSTFHLRLEARHGGAYDASLRRRSGSLLTEARAATAALAGGAPGRAPDRAALGTLRSAPLDARRKLLAAAVLLAAPASDQGVPPEQAQDGS